MAVPQVDHTFAVLLAKPFWMWGAEMGMNEHGVTIGNEAIFTKIPYEKDKGLLGMDFIRLALERARTAWEALYVITHLLEAYGQGGNCGFTRPFFYHNSYLIADLNEAWVLETADRQWVAQRVKDIRSISNSATIGKTWDLSSDDLVRYAIDRGWCKNRDSFHFARCYSDFPYTTLSDSRSRQSYTTRMLQENKGRIGVQTAAQLLRSHGGRSHENLRLDQSFIGSTVCMHAGTGPVRASQSVGSMIAHLAPNAHTAWVTGTSAPCTGIYKPLWIDAGQPLDEPSPGGQFDPRCLWWRGEQLHRQVLKSYAGRIAVYQEERDTLEKQFFDEAALLQNLQAKQAHSEQCFQRTEEATRQWTEQVQAMNHTSFRRFYYQNTWKSLNELAGME
jgi:dipeptidase